MLFFALLLVIVGPWPMSAWATLPDSFRLPIWAFQKFHVPFGAHGVLIALEIIYKASLALACIGFLTRPATAIAAVLGVYLIGYQYSYGKVDHMAGMFLFTTGILALSRCGDAVSVDALIRRKRGLPDPEPSGEYRWPVRMTWVLMACIFFNAGMAKIIRGPGSAWVFSENFAIILTQRRYMTSLPPLDWGMFFAKYPLIYKAAAAGAILGELFMFLALLHRWPRMVLPWMLLSMQIGIGLFMRVWFHPYMIVYLFWIPWDAVFAKLRGKPAIV